MNKNSVEFFKNIEDFHLPNNAEISIIAWRLKNSENIGHIIRLAHNLSAKEVLFVKENETYRSSKIKKIAGFSYDQMNWRFISENEFERILNDKGSVYAVETCNDAKNIYHEKLPKNIILIVGNESSGIPVKHLNKNLNKIYIPMIGDCKSMNVSHALSVASFEWLRQNLKKI